MSSLVFEGGEREEEEKKERKGCRRQTQCPLITRTASKRRRSQGESNIVMKGSA
jgi:hypothetical protein